MPTKQLDSQKRHRSGSVLVLMLVVLSISFIIGTSLMAMGKESQINAIRQVENLYARTAADSGLQYALQQLNNAIEDDTFSVATLPSEQDVSLPYSDATFSYTTSYSLIDGYEIECTGYYNNRSHTVRVSLDRTSMFDKGISCQTMLSVNNGAVLDAYDSRISNDPEDCSEKIVIGSQCIDRANVNLDLGVVVDGDIFCGPGQDVSTNIYAAQATVTGDQYAIDSAPVYPILTPPTMYGPDTILTFSRDEKTIGPDPDCDYPATGRYSNINLGVDATLRVTGDCTLVISERINIGAKCTLLIEDGASLTIYVGLGWNSGTGCDVINQTGDPSNLRIIQTSDHMIYMDIQAKNDFSGVIYAPLAGLNVSTASDFRGAVVSYSFDLNNAGRFLYDVALEDFSLTEGGAFEISRWSED